MNDLKAVFRSVFQFLQKLFCQFEALIRGFAEPFHIFSFVLFNTIAVFVADVEIVLRLDMPLFGGLAIPVYRLGFVQFNAHTVFVTDVEIVLRLGIAPFGGFPNLFDILTGIYRTTR